MTRVTQLWILPRPPPWLFIWLFSYLFIYCRLLIDRHVSSILWELALSSHCSPSNPNINYRETYTLIVIRDSSKRVGDLIKFALFLINCLSLIYLQLWMDVEIKISALISVVEREQKKSFELCMEKICSEAQQRQRLISWFYSWLHIFRSVHCATCVWQSIHSLPISSSHLSRSRRVRASEMSREMCNKTIISRVTKLLLSTIFTILSDQSCCVFEQRLDETAL